MSNSCLKTCFEFLQNRRRLVLKASGLQHESHQTVSLRKVQTLLCSHQEIISEMKQVMFSVKELCNQVKHFLHKDPLVFGSISLLKIFFKTLETCLTEKYAA